MAQGSASKRTLVNEAILAPEVRLIDKDGGQVGVVPIDKAMSAASTVGLDLVLIAEQAEPPVAKIMDYGRHIFSKKKTKAIGQKKQKQMQVKEIKFRPSTDIGDYNIKLRNLIRFLEAGDKAKVTLRFRGREMVHQELGMEVLKRVEVDLEPYGMLEIMPKMEGRQLSMVFAPRKKGHGRKVTDAEAGEATTEEET